MEKQFLENRKKKNYLEALRSSIKAGEEREGVHLNTNAKLFLQLLIDPKSCGIKSDSYSYGYLYLNAFEQDERVNSLLKLFRKGFLESEQMDVLVYIFGEEYASYLYAYWQKMQIFPFATGYAKRSFRAIYTEQEEIKDSIIFKQCSFLIEAISNHTYDLRLEEYIAHSNVHEVSVFPIAELLAGAILSGNTTIEKLLIDIVMGNHDSYKVSRSIIEALLYSESKEGIAAVKKLLLAAQRQEGLRQTILESVDQGSVAVFKEFIQLINREKMYRFASVVRAFDVWTGLLISAEKQSMVKQCFLLAEHFLEHPELIEEGIQSKDNLESYIALWACATENTGFELEKHLKNLATDTKPTKRLLALRVANELGIESYKYMVSHQNLEDENETVRFNALEAFNINNEDVGTQLKEVFVNASIELIKRIPREGLELHTKLFSWEERKVHASELAIAIINVLNLKKIEDCERIYAVYQEVDADARSHVVNAILPQRRYNYQTDSYSVTANVTPLQRDFAFRFLQDKSISIREHALQVISCTDLHFEELSVFIDLLRGKSKGIKKLIHKLFFDKNPSYLLWVIETLLVQKNAEQRLVGLDYLVALNKGEQLEDNIQEQVGIKYAEDTTYQQWIQDTAHNFIENRPKLTSKEQDAITLLQANNEEIVDATYENGYGGVYNPQKVLLINYPENRCQTLNEIISKYDIALLTASNTPFKYSQSVDKINTALADLAKRFKAHAEYEYVRKYTQGSDNIILGNAFHRLDNTKDQKEGFSLENYPLADEWDAWYQASGLQPIDLLLLSLNVFEDEAEVSEKTLFPTTRANLKAFIQTFELENPYQKKAINFYYQQNPLTVILQLLENKYRYENKPALLLSYLATCFNAVDAKDYKKTTYKSVNIWEGQKVFAWYDMPHIQQIIQQANMLNHENDNLFKAYWELSYWQLSFKDIKSPEANDLPTFQLYAKALQYGLVEIDELYWKSFAKHTVSTLTMDGKKTYYYQENLSHKDFEQYPILKEIKANVVSNIIKIELGRTISETSVSNLIHSLERVNGLKELFQFIAKIGKENFVRGERYYYSEVSLADSMSHLIRKCHPKAEDSQNAFEKYVKESKLTPQKMMDIVMYAPQWLPYVERHLGWKLSSAVWWLQAHTKDENTNPSEEEIAQYSKLSLQEFTDGAVDVNWFTKAYKELGKKRWEMVYKSAKFLSTGGQKRAQLYADVILGKTKITEVRKRVEAKRNQDYLKVFGLVPLSRRNPEKDVLTRYQFLQRFLQESKQFGSQRQASEKLSTQIAMDNLARTAGYPDPQRLTWAMEAKEVSQIMENAVVNIDELTIRITISLDGKASLSITKAGKIQKSIPVKYRKDKRILALKEAVKKLKAQYKRARISLEQAMISGDAFTSEEMHTLMAHPVIEPLLKDLVFISGELHGFWKDGALQSVKGVRSELEKELRIAHCTDLFKTKEWSAYQHYCFANKLKQPFKQIFRELYLPTADEKKENHSSRRYAGHQVQANKTLALLKSRGWIINHEEGLQKVFHNESFIVNLLAYADWFYPSDVESPSIEVLEFYQKSSWKPLSITEIPERAFSEIMRDLDLVVSVAHVGDVDPETSQSSIELRAAIARETALLFKLSNVTVKESHILIEGSQHTYSLHLGSGVAHILGGTAMQILPVHSQHRGRIFLPFVDEDPKTAEIISKMLLLAKDDKIQDPTILRQLANA